MHPGETLEQQISNFLAQKSKFQLGELMTEQGHSLTQNLSDLAKDNPEQGLATLLKVDQLALRKVKEEYLPQVEKIRASVADCLHSGGRVFLGGCGATGRLSICLERLWREDVDASEKDSMISFMAGGDVAFVHAIEGFEDYPEYGAHQLEDVGFTENDLFIGITEGGETPFVIGATQRASEISKWPTYFLFSNPVDVVSRVERSRKILETPGVVGLAFPTGPMALAGSTRMQSSSVLMMVAGLALKFRASDKVKEDAQEWIENLIVALQSVDLKELSEFCEWEASIYEGQGQTLYCCDEFSVSVFTDTTERAPTFSLASFDNQLHPQKVSSLTYVCIPEAQSAEEAWEKLFYRKPRTLEWSDEFHKTRAEYLKGFDFSKNARVFRSSLSAQAPNEIGVYDRGEVIEVSYADRRLEIKTPAMDVLAKHLLLKLVLNAHSTLLMGRLGRYESHFMTYVSPSNGKLIDRASRYILQLASREGVDLEYDLVAEQVLRTQKELVAGEPVVLKVLEKLT